MVTFVSLLAAAGLVLLLGERVPYPIAVGVWLFSLVACASAVRVRLSPSRRRKSRLEDAREVPAAAVESLASVGQVSPGARVAVSLSGTVECDVPLTAPLSGAACAAYQLDVEVLLRQRGGTAWVPAPGETRVAPFRLNDGGASVPVLPERALLDLQEGLRRRVERDKVPDSPLAARLETLDAVAEGLDPPAAYRAAERVLPIGATAYVVGALEERDDGAALGAGPDGGTPLVISDLAPGELARRDAAARRGAAAVVAAWALLALVSGWQGGSGFVAAQRPVATPQAAVAPASPGSAKGTAKAKPVPDADWLAWTHGDPKVSGTARATVLKLSGATAHPSLREAVQLDFEVGEGWRYALLNPPARLCKIEGKPRSASLWVYGDGSCNDLRCTVDDHLRQTFQFSYGQISWKGWRRVTTRLTPDAAVGHWAGPNDGIMRYPISWGSVAVVGPGRVGGVRKSRILVVMPTVQQ